MMVNHSVHYVLLDHEILQGLKGQRKIVTWLIWCKVLHLTVMTKSGYATIQQSQMAKAFKCHQRQIQAAIELLEKHGMIKCVLPPRYSKGQAGSWVLGKACIQIAKYLYPKHYKAVSNNGKAVSKADYLNKTNKSFNNTIEDSQDSSSIEESRSPSSNNQPPEDWDDPEYLEENETKPRY